MPFHTRFTRRHPNTDNGRPKATFPMIQLAFIRLYIGLDLVPHFTEKLFAGPKTRADDVTSFQELGISVSRAGSRP